MVWLARPNICCVFLVYLDHSKSVLVHYGQKLLLFKVNTFPRKFRSDCAFAVLTAVEFSGHTYDTPLTSANLSHFDPSALRHLSLGGESVDAHPKMNDTAFAHIAELRLLEHLDMCGCDVSDEGVRCLANLPLLRYLNLSGCGVTDDCLQFFTQLPLETLKLCWCMVNDAA